MGDVLIQPIVQAVDGVARHDATAYWAKFSHGNEAASPGYYSVGFDNGIKMQLAVTTRAGIGEFAFPASGEFRRPLRCGPQRHRGAQRCD